MYTERTDICTCPPVPCNACADYNISRGRPHQTVGALQPDAIRQLPVPPAQSRVTSRDEVITSIGAWIVVQQRFPLTGDWRLALEDRPPLSAARIYAWWRHMTEFYGACLAAGYGTTQMLREANRLGRRRSGAQRRGTKVYEVIHE